MSVPNFLSHAGEGTYFRINRHEQHALHNKVCVRFAGSSNTRHANAHLKYMGCTVAQSGPNTWNELVASPRAPPCTAGVPGTILGAAGKGLPQPQHLGATLALCATCWPSMVVQVMLQSARRKQHAGRWLSLSHQHNLGSEGSSRFCAWHCSGSRRGDSSALARCNKRADIDVLVRHRVTACAHLQARCSQLLCYFCNSAKSHLTFKL